MSITEIILGYCDSYGINLRTAQSILWIDGDVNSHPELYYLIRSNLPALVDALSAPLEAPCHERPLCGSLVGAGA